MSNNNSTDPFNTNLERIEDLRKEAIDVNNVLKDFFNNHEIFIQAISLTGIRFRSKDYMMNFSYDVKYVHQLDGVSFIFNDGKSEVGCSIQDLIEFTLGVDGYTFLEKIRSEENAGGLQAYDITLSKYLDGFFVDYNNEILEKIRVFLKSKCAFL